MPTNSNESYCTFTLASDVTAGGLPSEEEIAKQLENNDPQVREPHHTHLSQDRPLPFGGEAGRGPEISPVARRPESKRSGGGNASPRLCPVPFWAEYLS